MTNHKFIFICGLHRSGTSLLHKILRNQKDISGFENTPAIEDEGQHLQTVFNAANKHGGPGKFGFDSSSFLDANSKLINPKNKKTLLNEWNKYWNLNKEFLVEKSPPNLVRTLFLQALFPNSYFITIYRHPVATSLATKKWSKTSYSSLISHWLICHKKFISDRKKIKNSLEIKYEDLTEMPTKTLNTISKFLNTEVIIKDINIKKEVNQKYFNIWKNKKKNFFLKYKINSYENCFEKEINEFDYSFKNI